MITLSVLGLSIFVLPIVGSTIVFRYFFPKHAIRISDSYLITIGTSATLLINLPAFYFLFKVIVPNSVLFQAEEISYYVIRSLHNDIGCLLLICSVVIILPILFSSLLFCLLKNYFWNFFCANQERGYDDLPNLRSKARFRVGEFISNSILNYMAKLTIYDENNEILIVDILDSQDSLYSGIFTDFFMEGGKFTGVSLASVIRYSFKNEKDRKEAKNHDDKDDDEFKRKNRPYILPRLGEMYFPSDKIQNLHFWKIKKGFVFQRKVTRPFDQAMIAWFVLLQNTYRSMNFSIKAYSDKAQTDWPVFTKALEVLPLDLSNLEIITPETESSENPSENQEDTHQ